MRILGNFLKILVALLALSSCRSGEDGSKKKLPAGVVTDSIQSTVEKNKFPVIPEIAVNDLETTDHPLSLRLKKVRDNVQRIHAIEKWSTITERELPGSTEGGEGLFFYNWPVLEKIVARNFGETFQVLREYYLLEGKLSFVFEAEYRYNRPIYYDSATMKESGDTEVFDFAKSTVIEKRNYFEKGKLFHQLKREAGKPLPSENLKEEGERIIADFEAIIQRAKDVN